jgi:hypothetical protein
MARIDSELCRDGLYAKAGPFLLPPALPQTTTES